MESKNLILPVKENGSRIYDIVIRDHFEDLAANVSALGTLAKKVCIVTDTNVQKLYAQQVKEILAPLCREVYVYAFPAGEEHKTLDEIRKLLAFLIENKFDRKDMLAALGGGVTGDMTGFASAVYLRGIDFIQIPTTLLSQVDSSIGGKTGVDFDAFKNMVGAFHQPKLVYINTAVLSTLSEEQFASGMGEVVKHGLIRDEAYYEMLLDHIGEIAERDSDVMMNVVEGSCLVKRAVVEKDPKEQGERALLNFGHTIGHAIEKLKDFQLPHGYCVALGSVAAAFISYKRGYLDEGEFFEIRDMMVPFGLPISYDGPSPEEILEATKHDKKMSAGKIRFVLLKGIGKAVLKDDVTDEEIRQAVRSINAASWEQVYDEESENR